MNKSLSEKRWAEYSVQSQDTLCMLINFIKNLKTHAFDFNSAEIPSASGCLSCPDFTRTAQLVQQPAK